MGLISRVSSRTYRNNKMATNQRPQQAASSGSATQTIISSNTSQSNEPTPTLRLTGHTENSTQPRRGIRWTEDTVDNEHLGKKSSKKCCIFHKPKADPRDHRAERCGHGA